MQSKRVLFLVRNIPWTINDSELKKYFQKFGSVKLATVIFDKSTGISKNYGYVEFINEVDKSMLTTLHKLEGHKLKVLYAHCNNPQID